MFYLMNINLFKKSGGHVFMLLLIFLLQGCLPADKPSSLKSNSISGPGSSSTTVYPDPSFPLASTFLQEGTTQSTSGLILALNFIDTFLIRGKALSTYLKTIPLSTKFCVVGKYNFAGSDKFLILSAKNKSYTDLYNKTTENYLYVEPSNDVANQTDCLVYNLTNTLFTGATSPTASFSLTQLCSTCTTAATSGGLKLYFTNGQEVSAITMNSMTMTISGNLTSNGNTCSDSSACVARGFNCCLNSQCVNDGAIRPSALTATGYTAASIDVASNPERFVLYPQFYFVCDTRPESPPSSGGSTTTDPNYAAQIRVQEQGYLYQCLNKVNGEFSYCTEKITSASTLLPGIITLTNNDDINFSKSNPNLLTGNYVNNIVKINYGGDILYELSPPTSTGISFIAGSANDILTGTSQRVNITQTLSTTAKDDNLYITYKVDGTCEKISSSMAKCSKTFIQGSSDTFSTYYHDTSKNYILPIYADLSASAGVIVKLSGIIVPEDATTTWTRNDSTKTISFISGYAIQPGQSIEITYYVTNATFVASLTKSKITAQATVNAMCVCGSTAKCNLNPVYNANNLITDYECAYPSTAPTVPVNQTVFISNKNVPHRYYDKFGVNYDTDYSTAADQEYLNSTNTTFGYTNSNTLRPNNVSTFIGFNEIYGSFGKSGTFIARPAKLVNVKKNTQYDIIVNSGVFSTCTTCGTDFYSSLVKIFPQNFSGKGGGYSPNKYESSRLANTSTYRAENLLFGRACFLPATMIPWTHNGTLTDVTAQRRRRLAGQHFLFANGYQRDWFGFDYGSVIGSFDGVTWFSVGNQRRIKATSPKLFLAVNAYFGDLSVDSNFNISVAETSIYSSDIPDHDTETDGAECQQSHYCSTDNDCIRQVGYDYTCQNVTSLMTPWPSFDANSTEVIGSTSRTLLSLVGGSNGQTRRCVYRGRGAPCHANLSSTTSTFNNSTLIGNLACSANNVCGMVSSSNLTFNDRIARFANTPSAQNSGAAATPNSDLVGLGARILGHPFEYYGAKATPADALSSLSGAGVSSICIPAKNVATATDTFTLNSSVPSTRTNTSDKILGVGPTISGSVADEDYLRACPATNTLGAIIQQTNIPFLSTASGSYTSSLTKSLDEATISQNMSSNLLNLAGFTALNIFNVSGTTPNTAIGYQPNTCLRAPGASCFSDMECAPSSFVGAKARSTTLFATNTAEQNFWQEDLVCGNTEFKYTAPGVLNPVYDTKKNVCCRETGKTISVFTEYASASSTHAWCTGTNVKVAGFNTTVNDATRYSRVHTAYDKMSCNTGDADFVAGTKNFALKTTAATTAAAYTQILKQYKTLDTINQRTCCTQHWVRSFDSSNGGGHAFTSGKTQSIDKTIFKHISWNTESRGGAGPQDDTTDFECTSLNYLTTSCEIRALSTTEEAKYLNWAGALELVGIPQVAVPGTDQVYKLVGDDQLSNAAGSTSLATAAEPLISGLPNTMAGADFNDGTYSYFSAANSLITGVSGIKKIFSENEFNCCIPTNLEVPSTTTASQCCTGYIAAAQPPLPRRCCLPDYTDVTLYLNRYVSSQGRGLPDSAYDPKTGYIKDPGQVTLMVSQQNICCSGKSVPGVAVDTLPIPLANDTFYTPLTGADSVRRFVHKETGVDSNSATPSKWNGAKYDVGVRWNNHIYCVPSTFQ